MDMKTTPETFGKMLILKAKESESFQDRVTGFVARLPGGSEYYGETRNRAIQLCIKKAGTYAL
jgi:hypothetical protein